MNEYDRINELNAQFWNGLFYLIGMAIGLLVVIWVVSLFAGPLYRVWQQRLQGQADLAQAEAETRIAIRKADAEYEAAKHYAKADIERAKGIAQSIALLEDKLGGPEGYLRWKYIHMLEENGNVDQIIYVPTETGLPILEAAKRPTN